MIRVLFLIFAVGLYACGENASDESDPQEGDAIVSPSDATGSDASLPVDATSIDAMNGTLDAALPPPDMTATPPDMMVAAPDAETSVVVAQCDQALGGDPWETMVAESQPGFEDDLAAISLDGLPDTVDISALNRIFRGILAYTLDIPPEDLGDSLQKEDILARGVLGRVAAASLVLGATDPTGIDFLFLRRGLHRYYHCDRDFPTTLNGFRQAIFDYSAAPSNEIDSIAKCGARRLIVDADVGVYIAETLVGDQVRETEILLSGRRQDGNLDFLIYNADGNLSDRTRFPTRGMGEPVMTASPYACTACHVNMERTDHTAGYETLFPEVGPCAQ
jgi:hypothetical protein